MTLQISTHKNMLLQILKDIYTNTQIGPVLGFKGGTAMLLFYDLERFSVDLDFDLLDLSKKKLVLDQVHQVLKEHGDVKQVCEKRYTIFFLLSYKNKQVNAYNIKVEVNLRNFGSRYELKSYLGIPMKVMIPADIVSHKMVAMFERIGKANRDIFDVHFFLKNNWEVNKDIIKLRTGLNMQEFLKECIRMLDSMSNRNILSGLGELLNQKQKAWVKEKLISETMFLLKLRLQGVA